MCRNLLVMFFMLAMFTQAKADCLSIQINDMEYPAAREALIKAGWSPKYISPAFDGAPLTHWVKIRNFAEVDACAGTGAAPCKFLFESIEDASSNLAVFTQGEDIGFVTGHKCTKAENN